MDRRTNIKKEIASNHSETLDREIIQWEKFLISKVRFKGWLRVWAALQSLQIQCRNLSKKAQQASTARWQALISKRMAILKVISNSLKKWTWRNFSQCKKNWRRRFRQPINWSALEGLFQLEAEMGAQRKAFKVLLSSVKKSLSLKICAKLIMSLLKAISSTQLSKVKNEKIDYTTKPVKSWIDSWTMNQDHHLLLSTTQWIQGQSRQYQWHNLISIIY